MQDYRVIFFHKQASSARTRFLRFDYHSVCAFEPLPRLAMVMDDEVSAKIALHPTAIVQQAEQRLGLNSGDLEMETEYQMQVDIAGGPVSIHLLRFTGIDPPFDLAEQLHGCFVDLPEARDLGDVDLLLLRKAYEVILGG